MSEAPQLELATRLALALGNIQEALRGGPYAEAWVAWASKVLTEAARVVVEGAATAAPDSTPAPFTEAQEARIREIVAEAFALVQTAAAEASAIANAACRQSEGEATLD